MEPLLHFVEGETLAEGQLRTTPQDVAEFFEALNAARVVVEVGTHSAWVQEVICGYGHEVLVANPRLMEGSKRRKRKNDRIEETRELASLAKNSLGGVGQRFARPIDSTAIGRDEPIALRQIGGDSQT